MTRKTKVSVLIVCLAACFLGVAAQSLIRLTSQVVGILPIANGGIGRAYVTPCSEGIAQFATSDSFTNSGTGEQVYATKCTIAANYFNTNTTIRGSASFDYTTGATIPTYTFKTKLCTVSGCGSGTVVNVYSTSAATPSSHAISNMSLNFLAQGTQTAAASTTIDVSSIGVTSSAIASTSLSKNGATAVATIPTNGTLYLQFSITFGGTGSNNPVALTQLVVESLN